MTILVNRLPINYNKAKNMSPSRRKGSKFIRTYFSGGGGKGEVFRVLIVILVCSANLINAQQHKEQEEQEEKRGRENSPPTQTALEQNTVQNRYTVHRRQGYPSDVSYQAQSFLRTSFKPSPLLETYYENEEDGPEDFQDAGSMQSRFLELFMWNKPMPVTNIVNTFMENENELPFLQELSTICPRKDFFFGMNPRHMNAVSRLKDVIMEQRTPQDAIKMAAGLRDRGEINPHAWLRAVVGSTIHRRDLQGLRKPPMVEIMPSMFITNNVLSALRRSIDVPSSSRKCVLVDGSVGRDNGPENLAWYWREDIMLNSHHWYWHLSYPINGEKGRQDREGELFYFMHHTMLARFQAERLSVGLPPVRPFNLQPGSRIPLGYNPHMHDGNSGNNWSPRPPGVPVADIMSNRLPDAPFFVSVRNRSIQLNRIFEGISMGSLIDRYGRPIYLDTDEGINLLGNTVEANAFSVNPEYYGYHGIHNNGHNIISLALDPRNELGIPPGVMGEASTAMRDVMFYPYHEFIDNIFNRYKNSLPPYHLTEGDWPLLVQGVSIQSLKVQSNNLPANVLHTFWNSRRYDLSRGLDFNRSFVRGPLYACHQHLDHQDFDYELNIEKKEFSQVKTVTVRLFLGPRYDLKGRRYNLEEERHFMFIMDTFTVPLKVGTNIVRRKSVETPLTIDFPESLRELQSQTSTAMPYCGCGWPHHLLIPKGTREGLSLDLFAMVTDSEEDYVEPEGRAVPQTCRQSYIFCGLMEEKYPDARPMGYPFDRKLYVSAKGPGPAFLEHLVRDVPNMAFAHIKVVHFDELRNMGDAYLSPDSFESGHPDDENQQYLDDGPPPVTNVPVTLPGVIHIDGSNSLSSPSPIPRFSTSPESIESPEFDRQIEFDRPEPIPGPPPGPIPGPPIPPPPPPPRTILNFRLREPELDSGSVIHEQAPNFHSTTTDSNSNDIDEYISDSPFNVHEEIRNSIDKVSPHHHHHHHHHHPPPPPPPPFLQHIPHPHAQVRFQEEESGPPIKRPYRSAFRSSFRSLLKTFSPIGAQTRRHPKSVLALLG